MAPTPFLSLHHHPLSGPPMTPAWKSVIVSSAFFLQAPWFPITCALQRSLHDLLTVSTKSQPSLSAPAPWLPIAAYCPWNALSYAVGTWFCSLASVHLTFSTGTLLPPQGHTLLHHRALCTSWHQQKDVFLLLGMAFSSLSCKSQLSCHLWPSIDRSQRAFMSVCVFPLGST